MNNINCEHCGCLIDVEKNIKCPNCGAPFKNNKQYKEYQEYKKRKKEIELESQQISNDIRKDIHQTSQKAIPAVFLVIIFIFVFICFITFIVFRSITTQLNNIENNFPDLEIEDNHNIIDDYYKDYTDLNNEEINISFNEEANTDSYDIKVDKIVKYTEKNFAKNETYYGFRIVFNNKTSTWKTLDNIELTYINKDGNTVNAYKPIVSTSTLDYYASNIKRYEGYKYYQIPDYVKNVTIVFENINVKIENYKNIIK